jgi:hypothetical protein
MKLTLLAAIADSIATARCVRVATPAPDIEAAIRFIRSRFVDVDYDPHPDRITIFGDDPSIAVPDDGDGYEAHFVIDLVFPVSQSNPFDL